MAETVRIEIPIETIDDTEPELSNLIKKLGKAGKEADKFGSSADKARQKVTKFDQTQEKTQKSLSRWMKEKYEIYLEAKERITPVLQAVGGKIRHLAGKTWHITMRAKDMVTAPVRGILNILKNPVFQAGAILGVSIGLKDTVDTYKDFESAMSKVQAVSGATGSDMVQLTAKAEEMGAKTKFTATQSAEAFNYMAMAGWKTKDMLEGIEGIMNLSAASGEDLATTSDIVTDALTAFGLQAKDSGHFADVLAQAASNANTDVGMMGESFKYIAPVAGAMKYSVEDVSLALGLMANASVKGSMAGTSLKTALANMASPTKSMTAAMEKYGISLTDKGGKAKDLKGVLDNLRASLGNLSETEQTAAASTIFGKEAMAGMLAIVNASERDYKKLTKAVNNADGASENMAETMLDNLQGSLTLFQSAFDSVKLSVGKRMAPVIRDIADWLTDSMPDVEAALGKLMDKIESGVDEMKEKFQEISLTEDWQSADLFGKGKILWDEFITEPFADWWNSTGKAKIADAMGNFGEMLGSGLHVGIMTLFGIDVEDTTSEAASIGKQFAQGFADGFDFGEISKKLWEGFGNMIKNAGKLLPGGQEADLSSLLSAAMLAKIAKPFFGLGSGTVKAGKAVFGGQETLGGVSLFSRVMGSTGNAMVGGSGLLGKMANVGYSLSNTSNAGLYFGSTAGSMSGGSAGLLGGASVAGGIIGAAGLIHGGMDIYTASKADDSEKTKAYRKAGAIEIGGTLGGAGLGAAAGAAIGSVIPVAGTAAGALIGAGVGAVGSWIAGNKIKDDYKESAEEKQQALTNQKKAYDVLGRDIDDVKFKTKKMNEALHDAGISTEKFAEMYQNAVAENLQSNFGDVTLSLEQVKKTADSVIFGGQKQQFEDYAEAANNTASSLDALDRSMAELNRQNWRAGLGTKMDDEEIVNYQSAMDNFAANAKHYLANTHYETTLSVELLLGKKGSKDMTKGFDKTYTGMEESLEKLSKKLSKKVEKALKDGVIEADEQTAITELQKKITSLTDKVSIAREKASRNALKEKYNKGNIDAETVDSMQKELAASSQEKAQQYYDALQNDYAGLEMSREQGKISEKKYQKEYDRLGKAYHNKVDGLGDDDISFQLDMLNDSEYGKMLDGILPDMKGSLQDKLKQAMTEAFVIEPDVTKWKSEDMVRWFGLDSLDDDAAIGAVQSFLQNVAESVPDSVKEMMTDKFKKSIIEGGTLTPEEVKKMTENLKPEEYKDWEKLHIDPMREKVDESTQGMNSEEYAEWAKNYMSSAISDAGKQAEEAAKGAGSGAGKNIIAGTKESVLGGTGAVRLSLEQLMTTATALPFTPTVNVNPNYVVTPFDRYNLFGNNGDSPGGGGNPPNDKPQKPKQNAAGGYAVNKQLSWLAEEGWGEYIIPTNPSRRGRALKLYEQAGRSLGVKQNAAGGFVGSDYGSSTSYAKENEEALSFIGIHGKDVPGDYNVFAEGDYSGDAVAYPSSSADGTGTTVAAPEVSINIQLNPEFVISGSEGQSSEQIAEAIRRHVREMADELGGEIAVRLQDVSSNVPLEGAEI